MAKSTSFFKTLLTLLFLGCLFITQSSAQGISLDQFANGKITSLNGDQPALSAQGWQNGNLNPNNCHLAESYSVPYRAYITGLTGGRVYTLRVGIDVKESGKIALDYFTGFQNLTPHGMFHHNAEKVQPLDGIANSGAWVRTDYTLPRPEEPIFHNSPLSDVPGISFDNLTGSDPVTYTGVLQTNPPTKRQISLFNAILENPSDVYYDPTVIVDFNQSTQEAVLVIKFKVSGTGPQNAVIAWGGHIAAQYDWGVLATPSNINGSPYHCRIKNLRDADGNIVAQGSTDRSLKASAVYRPPVCGVTGPQKACEGTSTGFIYSYTGGTSDISNYSWTLGGTDASKYRLSNTGGTVFNATTLSGATYNSVKVVPLDGETYLSAGSFTLTLTLTNPGGEITCDATSGTIVPTPTVNDPANQVVCAGDLTTAVTFSGTPSSGVVYDWTNDNTAIGLGASGTGNIAAFTATNSTTAPITATITVTPKYTASGITCTGTAQTFTIIVNPVPTVNDPANQVVCAGDLTTAVTFSGTPSSGVVYDWTNDNTAIGLGASGTGNIAAFTATNSTTAPITATITVTPKYTANSKTCTGTAQTFTIIVNPVPTVNDPANQVVCAGDLTTAVTFSGTPSSGVVYNWTNSNTAIGLAASGTGNIAVFTATNSGSTPITATITVTPSYTNEGKTCTGTAQTFTIIVNPTPTVTDPADIDICYNTSVGPINFSGAVSGTVFNWTNSNTAIGLAASGTGNIAAFTATNSGSTPLVATITVTPSYTNEGKTCTGTAQTFTITVNPKPLQPRIQYTAPTCSQTTFSIEVLCPLDGSGKDYEYSKNGGTTWQESPTFSGIAAGAGFSITVRDKGTMCVSDPTTCTNYASLSACGSGVTTTSNDVKEEVAQTVDVDARIISKGMTRVLAAPNPFTDKVRFTLTSDVSGMGSLEIFNTMGQKIATVYQGHVEAGRVLNKEYNVERSFRANLIYVFRVGDQKTTGKLLNW